MKYRKRPDATVETQGPWQGHGDTRYLSIVSSYPLITMGEGRPRCEHCGGAPDTHGWIKTLEGGHIVCRGDWILTSDDGGESWAVKPDRFEKTYELVEGDAGGGV